MYRIFLVEDDETIAKLVRRHLEKWDYDVHVVQKFDAVMSEFASFDPPLRGPPGGRKTQSISFKLVRWVYFALNRRGLYLSYPDYSISFDDWLFLIGVSAILIDARFRAVYCFCFIFKVFSLLFTLSCSHSTQIFVNRNL